MGFRGLGGIFFKFLFVFLLVLIGSGLGICYVILNYIFSNVFIF